LNIDYNHKAGYINPKHGYMVKPYPYNHPSGLYKHHGFMEQVIPNNHAWDYHITIIGINITSHGSYILYSTGLPCS
jgi:hypothetical protein